MRKTKSLVDRITELKSEVDAELDRLAEERRPKGPCGVPAPAQRLEWMARAGFNPFEALLIASRGDRELDR